MSQGRGISDAVRNAIHEWITDGLVETLFSNYSPGGSKQAFAYRLRSDKDWVRRARRNHVKGFERDYDCKSFPAGIVGLRVHTNLQDDVIKYVTFRVQGKLVGGGTVHVPSVLASQKGRVATIGGRTTNPQPTFVPFTKEQLHKLETEMEYGSGLLSAMMEDRV